MKDMNNSYVQISSNLRDDARFRDEELWESEHVLDATRRMRRILDTKYQKANLSKIVSNSKHLSNDKQSMLYDVLTKYGSSFDVTLGTCKTKPLDIELHTGSKPYHSNPYPMPNTDAIIRT